MKIWACWKSVPNPDKEKPDKIPMSYQINPITGLEGIKAASCNNPDTWMTFEDAVKLKKSSRAFRGFQVALLLTTPIDDEDRLIGVDMDRAFNPDGSIKAEYLEWVAKFNTYFELSPGEDINGGRRGFCFGHFPTFGGKHQGNIEIYQNGKWMTVTGQKLSYSPATINNYQEAIEVFRAKYFKTFDSIDTSGLPKTNRVFTDEEIISRLSKMPNLKMRNLFSQLFYSGKRDDMIYRGDGGEWSHSDDDWLLACMVRYWVQEAEQVERIMVSSALARDKWYTERNSMTYIKDTILNVLGARTAETKIYMETVRANLPVVIDFNTIEINLPRYEVNKDGIFSVSADKDGELQKVPISSNPCVIVAKGYNSDQGGKHFTSSS
jgi:putative DNA primase/helicase